MSNPGGSATVRVYISYSNEDAELVDYVKTALIDTEIDIWQDHTQFPPGSPAWKKSVRQGIKQATHVVYIASESAAKSKYVSNEITWALARRKQVVPFWVSGQAWRDSAPLKWTPTYYFDGRGAKFASEVERLLAAVVVAVSPVLRPTWLHRRHRITLPNMPARLANLEFHVQNLHGMSAIVPPLVTIAAGSFLMGSSTVDPRARENEIPQHRVELETFQIGKYPVTVAEYALAVAAGSVRVPPRIGGVTWRVQLQHLDNPVRCISWQDAIAYVAWLREATGQAGWKLPSEAQWEKAARWDAGRNLSRIYPWGDSFYENKCNSEEGGIGTVTPVGYFEWRGGGSPYGVEDTAGNVWELTNSAFMPYPYVATDGRENMNASAKRTLRGGCWWLPAMFMRTGYRQGISPDGDDSSIGFRLAFSPSNSF